jgi:NAD(P)-dependent dehydrogenase (short-subunit alcohol dehydrogenase family)
MKLKDRVAAVTGSARGLGWEIAQALAEEGATVAVCDIDQSAVDLAAARLGLPVGRALGVQADVSVEEDVISLVQRIKKTFGRLDVLVNNAGFAWPRNGPTDLEVIATPFDVWLKVLSTNLNGTFLCSREALKVMREQRSGSIINISSNLGLKGQAQVLRGPYCASKFGIEGLTEVMALENRPYQIRVNTLRPGFSVAVEWQYKKAGSSGKKLLHPGIIRPCSVYLASDESADITGQCLNAVDWNEQNGYPVEWVVIP